ncbi:ATP-binding protein [Litoribacillus peritrichatus]|uniref:histidine kinase n=1 Tax=Litoribacillus peritrichatus TaxID=718191 RepID=A0ABP7NBP5_9GAMM
MKPVSLRTRFFSYTILVATLVMMVGMFLVDIIYTEELEKNTHEKLKLHIFSLLSVTQTDQGNLYIPAILHNPGFNTANSGLWAVVVDDQQTSLWHSLSLTVPVKNLPLAENTGAWRFDRYTLAGTEYMTAAYKISWDVDGRLFNYHLIVGEDESSLDAVIGRFRLWLFGGFFTITAVLLMCQLLALRMAFRPIAALGEEIRLLEQGQQHGLLGRYPEELTGVTENLNALIDKEHRQREKYRASMADLAHSLKTPIAIIRGEIDRDSSNEVMNTALQRINNTIEYQLKRAVISGHSLLSEGTQISSVLTMVVDALKKVYRDKALEVEVQASDQLSFRGDENDLMEIFGNLLDNAFKHCQQKVRVSVTEAQNQQVIIIEDDGAGFSRHEGKKIFGRGERLDNQGLGQGIGLAVVFDIVKSYEGKIETDVSMLGGAMFKITFSTKGYVS